jgi:hypothetical protein
MNNTDELLKRILLNMKYDSRKTLNENKLYIFEDEVIPMSTILTQPINGNLRSEKYPQLGKWGDGACKCDNSNNLEFKSSCCKKPKITVGNAEFLGSVDPDEKNDGNEKNEIDYYGRPLRLPSDVTEITKFTKWDSKWSKAESDPVFAHKVFPSFQEACQATDNTNVNKCITDGATSFLNKISENGVISFKHKGRMYRGCYKVKPNNEYINPKNVILNGYYGSLPGEINLADPHNNCTGILWDWDSEKSKKENKDGKNLKGLAYATGDKESYDSETGDEITLSMDK